MLIFYLSKWRCRQGASHDFGVHAEASAPLANMMFSPGIERARGLDVQTTHTHFVQRNQGQKNGEQSL